MSKLVRQYLICTFSVMGLCWGTCLLCSLRGVYMTENPLLYIPYLLGGFSPTIASYIALKQNGKVAGMKDWLVSVFDVRHNVFSYLLPVLLVGVFFFCLCSVSGYEPGAPMFALVFMIPAMLFGGGLEETGWRGILQPELERKVGYTMATVLVSVVWWLWHLPLFYINGVSQYGADFITFGINVAGLSFALSAIREITNSTFLCVLLHCLVNSLHGVFIVGENRVGNVFAAAVLILTSYIFLWIQKKLKIFT